ncbi:MAG: orotidine-5'-phosphate decarboxylase, partial [Planctomycetota bacterium]
MNFADRLFEAVREKGSVVVVGLDPRPELLPPSLSPAPDAGAEAVAKAFLAFNEAVIEAVAPYAVAVKPQVAFYEKLGPAGMETFARTCRAAAERGLLVIGDVKRGDIGSTAEAYADAWFGGPYACDAITLNPYLGADSLRPFVSRCEEGYGCFVLVRTSNPGAADLQDVRDARGRPLYLRTAEMLASLGGDCVGECGYSAVGAVVGATWPEQLAELRAA